MKTIAPLAIALMAANPLSAAEKFLDWQFNETSGTALNSTVNSGTSTITNPSGAVSTWNFGGPRTQNGVLNIGDTQSFKWNPNSTANGGPTGASGQAFRTALLTTAMTSGEVVFEYKIANWNLGGTDGVGVTNNGVRFLVGNSLTNNSVSLDFEVSQDTSDIRVQSIIAGAGSIRGGTPVTGIPVNAGTFTTNNLYKIATAGDTDWTAIGAADNNVGTLFSATGPGTGTGTAIELNKFPQNQLGAVNLVGSTPGTANPNAVTIQLLANLTTGIWSTRVKVGTTGAWQSLVTDGAGLNTIDRIQMVIEANNMATGWEYGALSGTATEFVQIDSVNLTAPFFSAIDFDTNQITGAVNKEGADFPFSLNTPKMPASGTYSGQPIYGALKLQPVAPLSPNGAAMVFAPSGGMKLQWNGPNAGSEVGRYAEGDVATGVFVIRRQEFLDGLNTKTVSFSPDNDTLAATVGLQHKDSRVASGRFRWVIKDSGNFYISDQVGAELTPTPATSNNAPVILTSEALSLTWNTYNPWDLNNLNPSSYTPVATPAFSNIQAIGVWLSATAGANPGTTNQYQGLQVIRLTAEALGATNAVADTTPPVITLNGSSSVTVAQNATYTDAGATATDAVDGTVDLTTTNPVDTAVIGVYTVTYNASDTSGNAATPVTRTVTVGTGSGFSSWITGTFANGTVTNQGPNDDDDNDGISNLVEYAIADQDPTAPNASVGSFASNVLSYTKRGDATGLTYAIEESTGLVSWQEVSGGSYVNNATTISYTLTPGTPTKNFTRLRVTSN